MPVQCVTDYARSNCERQGATVVPMGVFREMTPNLPEGEGI